MIARDVSLTDGTVYNDFTPMGSAYLLARTTFTDVWPFEWYLVPNDPTKHLTYRVYVRVMLEYDRYRAKLSPVTGQPGDFSNSGTRPDFANNFGYGHV